MSNLWLKPSKRCRACARLQPVLLSRVIALVAWKRWLDGTLQPNKNITYINACFRKYFPEKITFQLHKHFLSGIYFPKVSLHVFVCVLQWITSCFGSSAWGWERNEETISYPFAQPWCQLWRCLWERLGSKRERPLQRETESWSNFRRSRMLLYKGICMHGGSGGQIATTTTTNRITGSGKVKRKVAQWSDPRLEHCVVSYLRRQWSITTNGIILTAQVKAK